MNYSDLSDGSTDIQNSRGYGTKWREIYVKVCADAISLSLSDTHTHTHEHAHMQNTFSCTITMQLAKYTFSCAHIQENNASCQRKNEINILDISSGFLHLTADSLVPKSIGRTCFENAKVLPQVDRKFIPVVAGRTLALIDQVK